MKKFILLLVAFSLISGCGFYKKEAKEEISSLGQTEGYNKKVAEIQRSLEKAGFDPGPIDGKMGWKTREAIKNFQKQNKLKRSGFMDAATRSVLSSDENIKRPPAPIAAQSQRGLKTKDKLPEDKKAVTPEIIKTRLGSTVWIKRIQQALKKAGFDPGPIDGKMGPKTKKAITEFQKLNGLNADGIIDQKTWKALARYFPKEEE